MRVEQQEQEYQEKRRQLMQLHHKGDWRGVLSLLSSGAHEPRLLWPRTSEAALSFITRHVTSRGLQRLVSLGCGTGLLEWLLQQQAPVDVEVLGVEVDEAWWRSSYAPPTFLPLQWAEVETTQDVVRSQHSALLFCYFNCGPAWRAYLAAYQGPLVVVCGPAEGTGIHSDPQPFQPLGPEWTVVDGHCVGGSRDRIAVYVRI